MLENQNEISEDWSIAEGLYNEFPIIRYRLNLDSIDIEA
jgi:hypothetical protein